MYNMKELVISTFDVTFIDDNILHIPAPKVKDRYTLSKLISKSTLNDLIEAVCIIVNYNQENIKYSKEQLEEMLTETEATDFIDHYSDWLIGASNQKN